MMLCALFSLCVMLSHAAGISTESERRYPAPFGEQRKFSASSLPRVQVFQLPADLAVQGQVVVPAETADASPSFVSTAVVRITAAGPASFVGPYLRAQSPLADSERLVKSSAFSALFPSIRRPLKTDHDARVAERGVLLPEADWIDKTSNNRLSPWKERLDATLEKLEKEKESFIAAVAVARSKCMPYRDEATGEWCRQEKIRLEAWQVPLFNQGEAYNADLAKFHLESKPYDSRLSALVAKIEAWELAVYDLIGRIKKALNEEPDTETRTCTDEQHDKLQDDVDAKCKGEEGEKRACKGDQNCDVLRLNLAKNQACYAARVKIVDECYDGKPNKGHKDALDAALNAINICLDWIKKRCGGVGVGSAPL